MHKSRILTAISILLLFTPVSNAETKASCTILNAKRIFDGSKWNVRKTQIHIREGIIKAIGPNLSKKIKSCLIVDLEKVSITPGLIDTHTHIFLNDNKYGKSFSKLALAQAQQPSKVRLKTARENARALLYSGFTSIRDLGNSGHFLDAKLKQEQTDDPKKALPRLFISGPGWAIDKGQLPASTKKSIATKEYTPVSLETQDADIDTLLQDYKKNNVDTLKLFADNDPEKGEIPLSLLKKIIEAAKKENLPVATHATNLMTSRSAIMAGTHSLEHVFEIDGTLIKKLNKSQSFLVPTGIDQATCAKVQKHNKDPEYSSCPTYLENFGGRLMAAHKAKIPIAFGSDMYMTFKKGDRGVNTLSSLLSYNEAGLTPNETLKAATSTAAKLLQRKDLGVIKVGAQADIVAFNGDPAKDILSLKKVAFVMKGGQIYCKSEKACKK